MNVNIKTPKFLREALYNDYKYSIIVAGRRTGKTFNAVQWLVEELLSNADMAGLWVDTVQVNLDSYVKRYFQPLLKSVWHLCYYNERKGFLELPNKSYIDFRSSQKPEYLEGFGYQRGVINEAGIVLKKSELWHNSIYPMTKGEGTRFKIIGTPKGKNLFHKLHAQGSDESNPEYKSFHFSAYDSPFWNKEELDRVKNLVPLQVWQQEYLAQFVDGGGSVFRNLDRIQSNTWQEQPTANVDYILGIDLAKHTDFTVITVMELSTGKVVNIDRFNQLDWSTQKARIVSMWTKWNKGTVIVDSTGVGEPVYDDLRNAGIPIHPYKFTNPSKKLLIQNLMVAIENGSITIPNTYDTLVNELELFEVQITRSGVTTYNAPDGMHDDCVISLALCTHLVQNYNEEELIFV